MILLIIKIFRPFANERNIKIYSNKKMAHLLKNKILEVLVHLPNENYNHSRFDWSGKIVEVKFKGKPISGTEIINQNENQLLGKGFYNEFGINAPLGYDQLKKGEWFHKIGVGLLKKDDTQYDFHKRYEVQPANFEVLLESNKIRIKCQSQFLNGYSYFLEKEISLLESGFEVKYYLKNKGRKTIVTNEYNHNFLSINHELIDTNYILKFPFKIKPELFDENINPEQLVEIGEKKIKFIGTPKQQFFFSNLSGGKMVDAKWTLENTKSKIGISETGNFQTNSINLWGWSHVICPELFFPINIKAGQSITWSRNYHVYEISRSL